FIPVGSAAVDGHAFPYGAVVADDCQGVFSFELQVLRYGGDDRTGKYPAVFTDPRSFHNGYIGTDPGAFTDLHVLMYRSKRVDLYIRRDPCVGMYIRKWVDHFLSFGTICATRSASVASLFPTYA